MNLQLSELEQAINYWRALRPSTGEEHSLSPEVNTLATLYATMIFYRQMSLPFDTLDQATQQLIETWKQQRI